MQAIRAHIKADNPPRASALALELIQVSSEPADTAFAQRTLEQLSLSLGAADLSCDEDCMVDLDGKLQEYLSFFVRPDVAHRLTAKSETGSQTKPFKVAAGQTLQVVLEAPRLRAPTHRKP